MEQYAFVGIIFAAVYVSLNSLYILFSMYRDFKTMDVTNKMLSHSEYNNGVTDKIWLQTKYALEANRKDMDKLSGYINKIDSLNKEIEELKKSSADSLNKEVKGFEFWITDIYRTLKQAADGTLDPQTTIEHIKSLRILPEDKPLETTKPTVEWSTPVEWKEV